MKKTQINRKCSAALAAGAGAAVCLSGVGHAVTPTTGNANVTQTFPGGAGPWGNVSDTFDAFSLALETPSVKLHFNVYYATTDTNTNLIFWTSSFTKVAFQPLQTAGNAINTGVTGWASYVAFDRSAHTATSKYIAVKFKKGGSTFNRFGWFEVSSFTTSQIKVGAWGYRDATDEAINTLSDSITTTKLNLASAQTQLHWTNDNEDGVSRYEVQTKDDKGAWQTVDSDVPGVCSYIAKVEDNDADYRLLVEMVDGSTEEIDF